jgi:hypothetical protein
MKNFKKMSGLMALVFGLVIVFSQSAFKAFNSGGKRLTYEFKYIGPSNPDATDVETIANWQYDEFASQPCTPAQEKPCRLNVDAAYVNTSGTPTLDSSVALVAAENTDTDTYYLSSSADGNMVITNREE